MTKRYLSAILVGFAVFGTVFVYGYRHGDASTQGAATELEVELITLLPAQFEPAEITRPKGAFVLFIDDRTGRENSSLVLERVNSERLRAVSLQRTKSEWNDVLDLSPGTYVLRDSSKPELRCQITIYP